MSGQKTDPHHKKDDAGHDDNAGQRLPDTGENEPEHGVQDHDLYREPHLVIDKEHTEETADDLNEIEALATLDIHQDRIGQVDIVTDKERNKDREDPSFHESLEVGRIRRPSLDQAETGAEEEERHRQDSVVVVIKERTHPVAGNTEMIERDDGLMEYDEDRKETLEFLAHDPLEERRAVRRP